MVPLSCGLEVAGAGSEVLADYVVIECDAEAGPIRNFNPSMIDNWRFGVLLHHRRPPGNIERVIFKREEVQGRGRAMHVGHTTDRSTGKVHCHGYTIFFCHVADLVRLQDSA